MPSNASTSNYLPQQQMNNNYERRLNDDYYHQKRTNTTLHLDQLQEALLLQHRQLQEDEAQLTQECLSPVSSVSSCQDINQLPLNNRISNIKLKKRATSTSSGLKSLGRIFGGSKKNKLNDR